MKPKGAPNLANLSREEKLEMLDLLEKKEQFGRTRKTAYKPHPSQLKFHASIKPFRFVFCANGWGKSTALVNECFWTASGYNPITHTHTPVPATVIVVIDNPSKIDDVFLSEAHKWFNIKPEQLHKRGKPYVSEISFDNGSRIQFMSSQAEPLSFESIQWDLLAMDEPLPQPVFSALRRGGRKKGRQARIIFAGTPIAASWMRRDIFEPWARGELDEFECFRGTTDDNATNLADGYIESYKKVLSDKEQRIRLFGDWFDLDGLALAHLLHRPTHIIEPFEWPQDWPCVVAIDPHPSKAHHAVMVGCDRDGYLYYIKELKAKEVPRVFANTLKEWMKGYRVLDIVSDSLGSADGTGGEGFRSFIWVLNDQGVRARATTWEDKDDEDFIARIQDSLALPDEPNNFGQRLPKLRFWNTCKGGISDVENVQWVKYRNIDEYKPKLDISNKDFLSCLKYALATNLTATKHKARIYRPIKGAETYGVSKTPTTYNLFQRMNRK